ncbi:hypothetical protein PV409_33300 [Streptomyces sp. ME02-6979.5a]|uniref:hypothetical protein n=1 Tax=Streptomyces sp. ME02-6979.5a TaxID=462925 RepID=UPI0029BE091A|nr:hypothetical protein [Streptomyces sp. ME02-6979.5a]MDX3342837.1 hypothetical protein [Streptomyces sp. ME02-6979.5a]
MSQTLSEAEFLDGPRDKGQIRAEAWKRDERMEELAKLEATHPEIFDRMGISARMSLGYYQNDKANAAVHGRDVSEEGK